jgi:hypothetical protein
MDKLTVNILYNKANTFGLQDDIAVISRVLKAVEGSIGQSICAPNLMDMREPHTHCDIQIHLEIPVYSAIPWAHTNLMLVNPEQWSFAFDAYLPAFDALLFRDSASSSAFIEAFPLLKDSVFFLPWCTSWLKQHLGRLPAFDKRRAEFVCFVASSLSKYEYLKAVLPHWLRSDPPLTVYTTRNDFAEKLRSINPVVTVICANLSEEEREVLMMTYHGHLICSQGEAFGYAAAHAEAAGSFAVMNALPIFTEMYQTDVAWLSNEYTPSDKVRYSLARPTANIRVELDKAFEQFMKINRKDVYRSRQGKVMLRCAKLCAAATPLFKQLQQLVKDRRPKKSVYHYPPILHPEDCPDITVVTPTYHRKDIIDIAFHNILATDYPHKKIEWIIIEDNERASQLASEKIINFQVQVPQIKMKYIPIEGRMTIGEKRNYAIKEATADIILFMDDDDHYPSTSFRRRVAWLTKGRRRGVVDAQIACCTTLALYDLLKGTSAINVPPLDIPFSQRISEATLTFFKSAWMERPFPAVSLAEGEGWIVGRECDVIEIPPQQIIVAFTHGQNQSTRSVPIDTKPSCFWGFPKEYLLFIHKLVGVTVEEEKKD